MASILFKVVRICNSQFKCNYLKNKKLFLNFLFDSWNLHQILNILREKMIIIANVFPKLQTMKIWLDHSLKSAVWEHALTVNVWKRANYLQNLHESAFIMFFIILREVDLENVSPSVKWNLRGFCLHIYLRWQLSSFCSISGMFNKV